MNFPKIFRRQATFWTQVPGDLTNAEFVTRLNKGLAKKPDTAFETTYFLANVDKKLNPKKRVKLATKIGNQGQTNFDPGGRVRVCVSGFPRKDKPRERKRVRRQHREV